MKQETYCSLNFLLKQLKESLLESISIPDLMVNSSLNMFECLSLNNLTNKLNFSINCHLKLRHEDIQCDTNIIHEYIHDTMSPRTTSFG